MDKIIFLFIYALLLNGCNKKENKMDYDQFIANGYNLEFDEFPKNGTFNFVKDSLIFNYTSRKFKNAKLSLTLEEKNKIVGNLKKYNLLKAKGEIDLPLGDVIAPVFKDIIIIYKGDSVISKISIPTLSNKKYWFGQKHDIQMFYFSLKQALDSNKVYKQKEEEIIEYNKNNLELFL